MKTLVFQVELLSDIILPASSNTEGNIVQLDFIPGSNFLGMATRAYREYDDPFAVFHSGAVRFGDATILKEETLTYKIPFSFFHPKLDNATLYNHHLLDQNDFKELKQLKQMRSGYITKEKALVEVQYNYSQKSGYDQEHRRSKESSMYGYTAIQSGTLWQFELKYEGITPADLERIKSNLIGKRRLGKSKSSQYGQVLITQKGHSEEIERAVEDGEAVLYANSRLALVDEFGNATYDLKYLYAGLKDENILYNKSQLRTSIFTPYNGAMQTKTYARVVIDKGSVIVLKNVSSEQLEKIQNGVGVYLSEGFGDVLVNPEFLTQKLFSLGKKNDDHPKIKASEKITERFTERSVQFLVNRHNDTQDKLDLAGEVQKFIDTNRSLYENIKNAQWGKIRSICSSGDENFKEQIDSYISSGKAKWTDRQKDTLLEAIQDDVMFTKLLSIQMPKQMPKQKGDRS